MATHEVPENQCPHCGAKLDRATNADGDEVQPNAGDATICLHCAGVMVYGDDLKPRLMNELEIDGMDENTKRVLARGQRLVLQFIASRGKSE